MPAVCRDRTPPSMDIRRSFIAGTGYFYEWPYSAGSSRRPRPKPVGACQLRRAERRRCPGQHRLSVPSRSSPAACEPRHSWSTVSMGLSRRLRLDWFRVCRRLPASHATASVAASTSVAMPIVSMAADGLMSSPPGRALPGHTCLDGVDCGKEKQKPAPDYLSSGHQSEQAAVVALARDHQAPRRIPVGVGVPREHEPGRAAGMLSSSN
jgi:hypothetical protein